MANILVRLDYTTSTGGGGGIVEYANLAAFPLIGDPNLIYLALDTKKIYKWSSSAYLLISPSEVTSVNTEVGAVVLDKTDIGLGNVDNTSDANKPISTATQTALNAKQDSLGFTPENVTNKTTNTSLGTSDTLYPTQNAVKSYVDTQITNNATPDATTLVKGKVKLAGDLSGTADLPTVPELANKEPTITAGTTSQYFRGDKTFQTLDKSAVGLSNVDNTSDANKPISSATQTALNAKVETSLVGAINGVASLDGTGKVPSTQLPSYVDDVLEFANLAAFPVTGATGIIYVALDTNKCYRWSGAAYIEISPSEVNSVAGKTGIVTLVKADVGLSNVDNTSDANKPISTATQTALNAKEDSITAGTTSQYWRGDKTFQTLDKTAVGLSNVDNTSDANKPISSATQTALNGKANTAHVHALSDLTQSSATNGQVPSWNGTNWVPSTPSTVITDHTLLTNIGTNTHANIDTHIAATSAVHGVTGSVVGTSDSQALTNKTIDADLNTLSNIENADIKAAAAIDRTKLASGTADHVIINSATGVMSSEAALAASRGGLGTSGAAFTGVVKAAAGVFSAATVVNTDVSATAAIDRTKLASGTANRIVVNDGTGVMADAAAITASRALVSDSSGIPTASAVTSTELGYVSGVTSAIQTQINGKQNSLGFTPEDVANKSTTTSLGTSDTLYPTQNAVKTYVDNAVTGGATPDATTLVKGKVKLAGDLAGTADLPTVPGLATKEPTITAGTTGQYWRGDKSFQTLDKSAVGLANVDNTSDANKPISTATQTALNAKVDNTSVGAINGVASLDGTGKVPSTQLPSYVDDVLEFANLAAFPVTGETNKIYIALDTNLTYRWSGSIYVEISVSLALGETSSTAYRGDRGKTAYDHSQIVAGNPHGTTKSDVGLSNVDNTSDLNKPISTATQTALNGKADTAHVHALSDLTQSAATSGQVPSWNGTNWVPVTPSTGVTDHTLLTNIGTNTHAQIDTFMANTANVYAESKEPTGFFSRTTSTLSFDNGTRNFSITPTGATFDVWVKGVRYTKTGAQTIQIPALSGNHFIYFDATGALGTTQVSSSDLFIDNALISIIYWNTDTNTRTYFAEERHGMQMDGATHSYLHTVFGAQFISGLALQGFSVNGNGSLDAHAQFTSDSGTIRDEDIVVTISAQTQIPVLYRQGLQWRKKAADAFPFIYSGTAGYTGAAGRIPFNEFTGGAWQLTEIANNAFALVHLFGTNDIENPVVAIQGIATYGNVTAARLAASSEITSLSGLPFAEFVALGSVVLESSNSYTNTPQAIVRSINGGDYVDFRGTQLYTPAGEPTTHGLLSGLSSDDHLQYHTDARGDIRYYTKAEVDAIIAGITSPGDLDDTAFSFANNQSSAANVTGFAFANATVSSFKAHVSVSIDATTDLFEVFEIEGIQKGSEWDYSVSSVGDITGLRFSITNAGQIQYTSTNVSGFVSGVVKFRAYTTSR